ncbi:sodium transporter HKT1-like [Chenopodium quinoa]|uniref:sodium transporter HKT1-like n=1 Tax=Chenopodium quinoa TaxID=63459 RepID=UPI000B78DF35|nr:sodium transporter HKT1-like [Chenopodium quinoa]
MLRFNFLVEKFKHFYSFLYLGFVYLITSIYWISSRIHDFIISHVTHFFIEVSYFIIASSFGFLVLKSLTSKTTNPNATEDLDLVFTSVSAITVSSMSTMEMEVFTNSQLIVITILMFIGGEVFTSMVGLHFSASKLKYTPSHVRSRVNSVASLPLPPESFELGVIVQPSLPQETSTMEKTKSEIDFLIKSKSVRVLGFIVLAYLLLVHVLGISMVLIYVNVISSAKNVLEKKDLKKFTFSIFTIVSTFASCGFIPTNENMQVFSQNSGLLLILIPQILLGNTLFPSFLRFLIWVLSKIGKKDEAKYLMRNSKDIGFHHLLPSKHCKLLVVTVLGFICVQFILFCAMEWGFDGLNGLNIYQKLVGILFVCINSRHTGESIVDLSKIAPAILVLFVVMMYLPPYTSFLPKKDEEGKFAQILCKEEKKNRKILKNIIFSQLSYLALFIIIICITERQKMIDDPLNFNVFNITFEVISAYGNVGFSTGYSCSKQLKADPNCVNKTYGFAGSFSDQGKLILIIVMFFGRLKKFSLKGGKAWKLL